MKKELRSLIAAAVAYAAFAVYLHWPHFAAFDRLDWLLPVNCFLAAAGCFALSRRWVSVFWGSLVAGAVYGFGPYVLGLARFHPTAGLLAALVPWSFCPAVFLHEQKWRWTALPLLPLPFLVIVVFFGLCAQMRLFPVPLQLRIQSEDLVSLMVPLIAAKRRMLLFGFYHTPIAGLIIGLFMFALAKRYLVFAVILVGATLAACEPFLQVSTFLWLSIPITFGCVLIGAGLQALACAGHGDRFWILPPVIVSGALAIVSLLLATQYFQVLFGLAAGYARLFVEAGKLYAAASVALLIVFFMTCARLRLRVVRWVILLCVVALDVWLGARFVVDCVL